jgi:hypothetical protein
VKPTKTDPIQFPELHPFFNPITTMLLYKAGTIGDRQQAMATLHACHAPVMIVPGLFYWSSVRVPDIKQLMARPSRTYVT